MSAKVLIVDDSVSMTKMISMVLRQDYELKIAHNGLDAIMLAKEWHPDLVLLDIMMPDMNGYDVCNRLRQMERTFHTPIIMVSAKSTIDDKVIGFENGADDYIAKPFNVTDLKMRVASRLQRVRATTVDTPYVPTRVISVPLAFRHNRSGIFVKRYRVTKRLFDIGVCLIAAPIAIPLLLFIALAVRIDSPGKVVFVQYRTGKNGNRFKIYKFRTMVENAEELKEHYQHLNELTWPDFKITKDPRITRIGKFLRRSSLDELPQLWNIFIGEMSFVGPRPTSFKPDTYQLWQTERLEVTPGLTGLWQVVGRSELDFVERVELDIEYIERQSWRLDMEILIQTFWAVIGGHGAS